MTQSLESLQNAIAGKSPYIGVTEDETLTFKIQSGPIKEHGQNGCQVDALIEVAHDLLKDFNKSLPSRETSLAITKLEEALHWLDARTKDREKRGVEGTNGA